MTKRKFARIVSNIFVPPSALLLLTIYFSQTLAFGRVEEQLIFWSGAGFGFILPIIFFVILRLTGNVGDTDATIKEERFLPYIAGIIFAFAAFWFTRYFELPYLVQIMWITYFINTIILLIINFYWKISAHAIGNFSPYAFVVYLLPVKALFLIPLLLIILWSRLELKKHTPAQLAAGTLFGFGSTYLQILLYMKLQV